MIAALALGLTLQQLGNPVTEVVDPSAGFVSVQAIVPLPKLSGHERAELQILTETMAAEVDGYSRPQILDFAAMAGDTLHISLMPDHVRIQIGMLPGDMKTAIGYIDQILHHSRLMPDVLNRSIEELPTRRRSMWSTAIDPYRCRFERIRRKEILDLYHRIFRPDTVYLAVGGAIKPGEAEPYWQSKMRDWKLEAPGRASLDTDPPDELLKVPGKVSTVELTGKPIVGNDPAISTKILALIALGSGKGSTMFDVLRENHGWSYRQEAVLTPSVEGFTPRLIMATADDTPPFDLAKAMKEDLQKSVAAWSEDDLARARGMAEGILLRGLEMSPLYFNPSWPITSSLHDRTFMAAYWPMKTGTAWDPRKLLGQMALATVDEVKASAQKMLEDSTPRVLIAAEKE